MGLRKRSGQKTYSHLLQGGRRPSVYEIVSSRLHYYPNLGFSIQTPLADWYRNYQSESAFAGTDLELFNDPRRTTYTTYVQLQHERESYVGGVLEANPAAADAALDPHWLRVLAELYAPLRFPVHALMMLAGYLASMAPGSRVTICAAFQAADEIRRVHGLARRLHQLRGSHAALGDDARAHWLQDPDWQGLRQYVERTLVIYDWSECFVALNLVLKPTLDHLINQALADQASRHGDGTTALILGSMALDGSWHCDWSRSMLRVLLTQQPECRARVQGWVRTHAPTLDAALLPLARRIDGDTAGTVIAEACAQSRERYLADCGLDTMPT